MPTYLYCISQNWAERTVYSLNKRLSKERTWQYRWSKTLLFRRLAAALRFLMLWELSAELMQHGAKIE